MSRDPVPVEIGVLVEQIVGIDQKSENFTIAGHLSLRYRDPKLSYQPEPDDPPFRMLQLGTFLALAEKRNSPWPAFAYSNMQGKPSINLQAVRLFPDGTVHFEEVFTGTFQAPDFDFRQFPFDRQIFQIHVRPLLPSDVFHWVPMEDDSGLGPELGEEEWILGDTRVRVTEEITPAGLTVSEFTLEFSGKRHLTYYILRIFIPMLIILAVSWVTFLLKDYVKRVDMGITVLLLLIAFNFTLSTDLPRLGYVTAMDAFMGGAFAITGAVALINVWFRRLESTGREAWLKQLDRWIFVGYWPLYILGMSAALLLL